MNTSPTFRLVGLLSTIMLISNPLLFAAEPKTLSISAAAPDFKLPGVDGKMYSLQNFASANVLAVIFTCNHCPTAQAYEDRIKALVTDYQNQGVAVVAISPNDPKAVRLDELGYSDLGDSFEEMKRRAKEKAYNFPYLYDGDAQATAQAYGPVATPHAFVFDKARRLRYVGRLDSKEQPGTGNAEDIRAALDALLAGKPVPVTTTKTFGCSVKWTDKSNWVQKGYEEWAKEPVKLIPIDKAGLARLVQNKSDTLRFINVWATWCGPCVTEFPSLVDINRMYRGREFEFISISADKPDKREKALTFLQKKQASGTNYIFATDDIYQMIEVMDKSWAGVLPYTMVVAPSGKVVYRKQGIIDPDELKKVIVGQLGRYY